MTDTSKAGAAASVGEAALQELRGHLRGDVVGPGDSAYDAARSVWNGMIDKRPAAIARCKGVADVLAAVRFARAHDLLTAVRGGGHNVAGFGTCDGGLVIDLSALKGVRVDPLARTVRAQPGLSWGEFDRETQAFGLATTGGLVTTTGIAGFTLGGGIGWLMRKHGLTIDNLVSADVVTADGRLVTASPTSHPDLFWALRGGGGNFGIVTSFEYRLHPVGPVVLGGAVLHPAEKARELLRFYNRWVATLPDEMTSMVAFITAPPLPFIPQALHGTPMVAVAVCYAGAVTDGERVAQPLTSFGPPAVAHVGPVPYTVLQGMFDASAPYGIHSYWKTHYVPDLSDAAIDALLAQTARMRALSPFTTLHLHHLEGAVSRVDSEATAFRHRTPRYAMNIVGLWTAAEQPDAHIAWVRRTYDAMQPFATGAPYLNFLGDEGVDRVRAAYGSATYDRLAELKTRYDPTNFFRVNQNIRPAARGDA
ncbi:MAG TPA: FAD-binding oxidoreductase [bacterium]|nr:FAD-binding oxidoreductase [bacterium]